MKARPLEKHLLAKVLFAQESEITEHFVYARLSKKTKNPKNAEILQRISKDEMKHYEFWKTITKKDIKPNKRKIFFFVLVARVLGLTFAVRLMEKGEANAQVNYETMIKDIPDIKEIIDDEERHEQELIGMLHEEKLHYIGSVVLGLNDALVELTGTLAGLTFAFQNTRMIALAGFIMGIAASLSMASSEYLSRKADGDEEKALKASLYTGLAYLGTVFGLVLPYFVLENYFVAMGTMFAVALTIIFCFNFYISVVKDLSFKKRFWEMALLSSGVAILSFGIGYLARMVY